MVATTFIYDGDCAFCSSCARFIERFIPTAATITPWQYADLTALQGLPACRAAVRTAIDRVNAELSVIEKVRQFAFADEPFGIDNNEMTPTLKIRRHAIRERYGARIDALYKG